VNKLTKIFLAKFDIYDINNKYISWLNDPDVNKYLETKEASKQSAFRYIRNINYDPYKEMYSINVEYTNESKFIGTCTAQLDFKNNSCVIGIMIGDKTYWGKGYGTKAIEALTHHIKNRHCITNFKLACKAENIAAVKCYEKAGFKKTEISLELCLE